VSAKRISSNLVSEQPRLSYGIVVYDDGRRKHQRYFTTWEALDEGVEVQLVTGDWVYARRKQILRWPKREVNE